jgi:Uma2 family endonuclease
MTMERIQRRPLRMSADQFLAWAETQEGRYELLEGEVMMQAGATRDHERVAKRIFALLYSQVDEKVYDVNKGDFGVRIRPGSGRGTILYPDVLVDRQSTAGDEQSTTQPIVVIEVLSRSTDYEHHVQKLARYKKRDSLCQYVVFDQKEPRAFVWTKDATGWPERPEKIEGADGVVALPSIAAQLHLAEIYRP